MNFARWPILGSRRPEPARDRAPLVSLQIRSLGARFWCSGSPWRNEMTSKFFPEPARILGTRAPQAKKVAGRTYPRSGSRSPAAQDQSTESLQPLQERAQSGAQRLETLESIREPGRIEERAQDAKTAAHVESCRARPPEPLLRSASQRSGAGILSGHILRAPGRPSSSSELQPVFSASF